MRPLVLFTCSAVATMLCVGCADDTLPQLYKSSPLPTAGLSTDVPPALYDQVPETTSVVPLTAAGIAKLQFLGASIAHDEAGGARGVNFSVYSQRADKMQLLLFDGADAAQPTRSIEMTRQGDVWNVYVEGVGLGQLYGFVAWGPNWTFDTSWYPGSARGFVADVDFAGNRFNPNKLLFDPYCRAFTRDFDWSKASAGTGPDRAASTFAAAAKCVVVKSKHVWGPDEKTYRDNRLDENWVGHRWNDLIIYEVHPKGFTANSASGVVHPGTFRGFGEKADYFKELGITAVELMPPFEKPIDGGYWGYNTLSFFAPELTFGSQREREQVIDEFKWMVEQLHQRGIEVLVDIVLNHTGEGGLWRNKIYAQGMTAQPWNLDPQEIATLYGYRGLDNASYYALPPTDNRQYCDYTSVGNTTRTNGVAMRRLAIDSLRYWVRELHVDGFRFDLAPALGAKDLAWANCPTSSNKQTNAGITWAPAETVVQDVIDDPVLLAHNTRIIAEPWGAGGYPVGQFPVSTTRPNVAWSEWNGAFRDWAREFTRNDQAGVTNGRGEGGNALLGSSKLYQANGRRPYHSVNFITIHDGFTLYDLVSYDAKVNDCSPLNPICCTDPLSTFCDEAKRSGTDDNLSRNWGDEDTKRQMMRDFFTLLMVAQGTPMLYGGDEWLRTQLGNNNTYTPEADNPYSWHDWGAWQSRDERVRMFDFVKQVVRFRKDHAYALAPTAYDTVVPEWKTPLDVTPATSDWGTMRQLMVSYPQTAQGPALLVLINMGAGAVDFHLPVGHSWKRLIDTQSYFDTAAYLGTAMLPLRQSANIAAPSAAAVVPGTVYGVAPRSIVVLEGA